MSRIVKIMIGILGVLLVAGLGFLYMFRPLSRHEAADQVEKSLQKFIDKNDYVKHIVLRVYSKSLGYDDAFAVGERADGRSVDIDSRYHSASIGKTFTSTLAFMLAERGELSLDDPVSMYLDDGMLEGIYVYEGVDCKEQVLVRQLMNHTSGAGDYFEDPVSSGMTMKELMRDSPDRYFEPEDLVDFTRKYQECVGIPGETFHYSDTGYILLGMVLEAASGREFHQLLHENIFDPLGMTDSNLMFKSEPKNRPQDDMLELYLDGIDFSRKEALSIDWSGGGIVTTTGDLLKFYTALNEGELIDSGSLNRMKNFENRFDKGINYGMGMMEFDFPELSPLLKTMSNIHGGVGATGSFMMYDETKDLYIIMDVGTLDLMEASVQEIIAILMIYNRIKS